MNIVVALWLEFVIICYVISRFIQIMTGEDSPTEKREEFGFGRSTPPPTTSYVASKQVDGDIKTVAEPHKEEKEKNKDKDDDKDEIDILRPDANPGYNPDKNKKDDDEENVKKRDKREDKDRDKDSDRDKDGPGKKVDGSDILDGQWIAPKDSKQPPDDEEDDNCAVKCLYYTMQCCECSIS